MTFCGEKFDALELRAPDMAQHLVNTILSVTHGGGSIELLIPVTFERRMNASEYRETSVKKTCSGTLHITVRGAASEVTVTVLEWPQQKPDLNPYKTSVEKPADGSSQTLFPFNLIRQFKKN